MDSSTGEEIRALIEQAELLYASGDWDAALAAYDRILQIAPDLPLILVQRGLLLCEAGAPDKAAADFDRALEIDPRYGMAYYGRGWVKHERGDFSGELADAQHGLALDPDNAARYYLRMGSAYHGLKKHNEAVDAYSRSIELAPQQEGAIYNRGLLYADMKRHDEALADFDRALELDPDWTWALNAKVNVYLEQDKLDSALGEVNKILSIEAQNPLALLKRGAIYKAQGEREKSATDFQRVLDWAGHPEVRRIAAAELRTLRAWWLNGFFGLLTLQPHAYKEVAEEKGETWRAAVLVLAVGLIVAVLPLALNLQGTDAVQFRDRLVTGRGVSQDQATWAVGLIGVLAPLYWVGLAAITTALARLFGATPRFGPLLRATAYTTIFTLITIIPLPPADAVGTALSFWAYIIAVQVVLGTNYRRSLGLGCLSLITVSIVVFIAIVLLFATLIPDING